MKLIQLDYFLLPTSAAKTIPFTPIDKRLYISDISALEGILDVIMLSKTFVAI